MAHLLKNLYSRCCLGEQKRSRRMKRGENEDDDCSCEDVCHPFVNLDELLSQSNRNEKLKWCDLVQPLVSRSVPRYPTRSFYSMSESVANATPDEDSLRSRPQVLVCHDYKGNYLDDRFLGTGTRKWEEYRFYNWNVVDIFCYFSHNLITIPTLQYLNAAHLNGVKVIGTFIVEGNEGDRNLREILKSREICEKVADSLVEISKRLKFEGYLLNVEVPVNSEKIPMLKHFVHYLTQKTRDEIPNGMILWYDSVVSTGGLLWQNELNSKNEDFFHLSDGIFTNYNWGVQHLERTSQLIDDKYHHRRKDVFFGIDVFGRGQVAGFRTDETLSKIASFQFSTAIFAMGWTCESINTNIGFEGLSHGSDKYKSRFNEVFLTRNDRFWSSLYHYLYIFGPKELPFTTNFCIGSGKKFYRMGREMRNDGWYNLKNQAFQTSTPSSAGHFTHFYDDAFNGGSCLKIEMINEPLKLFACEFSTEDGIIFSYTFKREHQRNELEVHINLTNTQNNREHQIVCGKPEGNEIVPLHHDAVQAVNIFLANNRQLAIPSVINNWETRYYLLKFDKHTIISDIGVRKIHSGLVLLGQISLYSAKDFEEEIMDGVRKIYF